MLLGQVNRVLNDFGFLSNWRQPDSLARINGAFAENVIRRNTIVPALIFDLPKEKKKVLNGIDYQVAGLRESAPHTQGEFLYAQPGTLYARLMIIRNLKSPLDVLYDPFYVPDDTNSIVAQRYVFNTFGPLADLRREDFLYDRIIMRSESETLNFECGWEFPKADRITIILTPVYDMVAFQRYPTAGTPKQADGFALFVGVNVNAGGGVVPIDNLNQFYCIRNITVRGCLD